MINEELSLYPAVPLSSVERFSDIQLIVLVFPSATLLFWLNQPNVPNP